MMSGTRIAVWLVAGCVGLWVLGSGVASGQVVRQVRACGEAAGLDANAAEDAKNQALRAAVEQACGTLIQAESKAEDFELIYDEVIARSAGFVTEFQVVSTERLAAEGITRVTVLAKVSTKRFSDAWAAARVTIERQNNPRVVLLFFEDKDGSDDRPAVRGGTVHARWQNFFLAKGIQLMDKRVIEDVRDRDLELANLSGDVNRLAAIGASFKADVVVFATVEAKKVRDVTVAGRATVEWSATMSFQAVRTDDARVIASDSVTEKAMSTSGDASEKALSALAGVSAERGLEQVLQAWRKEQTGGREIRLMVEGMNFGVWESEIKPALSGVDGVRKVVLREMENNVAQIDVFSRHDANSLASRLSRLSGTGWRISVLGISANRVSAKLEQ